MSTILMLILGSVYAWSFFQKLIVDQYSWSNTRVAWSFSIAILMLGISAAWGGANLKKYGAQKLALIGVSLWSVAFMLGGLAFYYQNSVLLIFGFGFIGGVGLGLGYVTPVITAAKWFPEKKGLVTGMVIMGFGLGALLLSKVIAPFFLNLYANSLTCTFLSIGGVYLILGLLSAYFVVEPESSPNTQKDLDKTPNDYIFLLLSKQFVAIWIIFFINIVAGIMLISFQSSMIQDLFLLYGTSYSPLQLTSYGATLIAVSSVFNGIGRFFWVSISDRMGRIQTFRFILATQIIVFVLLNFVSNPIVFGALVCVVLLGYGGGFGTMPSFVADIFTDKHMSHIYGLLLTAWSCAGIVGPQIAAYFKDTNPERASFFSFLFAAVLLAVGLLLSFLVKIKPIITENNVDAR
ncbi:MAG: MFS transporter [Bacteroidales bacterium]|nr:MFS transporter [Bacteroidales bacterium]